MVVCESGVAADLRPEPRVDLAQLPRGRQEAAGAAAAHGERDLRGEHGHQSGVVCINHQQGTSWLEIVLVGGGGGVVAVIRA